MLDDSHRALAFLAAEIKIAPMNLGRSSTAMQQLRGQSVVLPSLLQCDFGNLEREIRDLEAADVRGLHLDVMDGHFVPNISYGMPVVEGIRRLTDLPIDVHLMISDPGRYAKSFVDAGADCLTIHAEIAGNRDEVLEQIRGLNVASGLAINPGTHLESIEASLSHCDLLLVMSVDAGFGGQKFNPIALEKLRSAAERHPDIMLEVDGGVNLDTISDCKAAGATLFVVGSAIFGQKDYGQALAGLNEALRR